MPCTLMEKVGMDSKPVINVDCSFPIDELAAKFMFEVAACDLP